MERRLKWYFDCSVSNWEFRHTMELGLVDECLWWSASGIRPDGWASLWGCCCCCAASGVEEERAIHPVIGLLLPPSHFYKTLPSFALAGKSHGCGGSSLPLSFSLYLSVSFLNLFFHSVISTSYGFLSCIAVSSVSLHLFLFTLYLIPPSHTSTLYLSAVSTSVPCICFAVNEFLQSQ